MKVFKRQGRLIYPEQERIFRQLDRKAIQGTLSRGELERADKVIRMNILAAKHFNMGLRAIFLSIGYLGWFVSPYLFIVTTIGIIVVLVRRQFYSEARLAGLERLD